MARVLSCRSINVIGWFESMNVDLLYGLRMIIHPRIPFSISQEGFATLRQETVYQDSLRKHYFNLILSLSEFLNLHTLLRHHKEYFDRKPEPAVFIDFPCVYTHRNTGEIIACTRCNFDIQRTPIYVRGSDLTPSCQPVSLPSVSQVRNIPLLASFLQQPPVNTKTDIILMVGIRNN